MRLPEFVVQEYLGFSLDACFAFADWEKQAEIPDRARSEAHRLALLADRIVSFVEDHDYELRDTDRELLVPARQQQAMTVVRGHVPENVLPFIDAVNAIAGTLARRFTEHEAWAAFQRGEPFVAEIGPYSFEQPKPMCCSFCGKDRSEVAKLIAGPSVYICNECVQLCGEIVAAG